MPRRKSSTPTTADIKTAVRKRDGMRCTRCSVTNNEHVVATGRQLEVHRTTPGSPYTIDGCVTLCKRCHGSQPRREPGQRDLGRPSGDQPLHAWIDDDIMDAFAAYIASTEPKVFRTSAIETALKDFLRSKGFWPPPPKNP